MWYSLFDYDMKTLLYDADYFTGQREDRLPNQILCKTELAVSPPLMICY